MDRIYLESMHSYRMNFCDGITIIAYKNFKRRGINSNSDTLNVNLNSYRNVKIDDIIGKV